MRRRPDELSPLQRAIVGKLKRVVVAKGLSYAQVGQRCGVHPRTAERFLEGETFSPETAGKIAAGLRVELDDSTEERLLKGLLLWRLHGSSTWWARLRDVAVHVDCLAHKLGERVDRAIERGHLASDEVRRGVRDHDAILPPREDCLTTSPRGVTMLSARACLWVLLTAETERGERAIATLVDEGLERLRSAGVRR